MLYRACLNLSARWAFPVLFKCKPILPMHDLSKLLLSINSSGVNICRNFSFTNTTMSLSSSLSYLSINWETITFVSGLIFFIVCVISKIFLAIAFSSKFPKSLVPTCTITTSGFVLADGSQKSSKSTVVAPWERSYLHNFSGAGMLTYIRPDS